jgi:hypothetical protein
VRCLRCRAINLKSTHKFSVSLQAALQLATGMFGSLPGAPADDDASTQKLCQKACENQKVSANVLSKARPLLDIMLMLHRRWHWKKHGFHSKWVSLSNLPSHRHSIAHQCQCPCHGTVMFPFAMPCSLKKPSLAGWLSLLVTRLKLIFCLVSFALLLDCLLLIPWRASANQVMTQLAPKIRKKRS